MRAIRDQWWELFGDPQLNALEEQVKILRTRRSPAAYASLHAGAGDGQGGTGAVLADADRGGQRHAQPSARHVGIDRTRHRRRTVTSSGGSTGNEFSLPFDASWTPDLWGRVRNLVKGNIAAAQASAADLANAQLTAEAELAVDYFQLRSQDALIALATRHGQGLYASHWNSTRAQFETGIGSDEAVAQAQVQLQTTQAQATNLGIARAQYEHAIAVLVGQPASTFTRTCDAKQRAAAGSTAGRAVAAAGAAARMSRPTSGSWPRRMRRSAWPRPPTFPH